MQSFEYRFVRTPVENLPPLKRDTGLESFRFGVATRLGRYRPEPPLDYVFLFPQKLLRFSALEYVQSAGGNTQFQAARISLGRKRSSSVE